MFNLLVEEDKKAVKAEYCRRLVSVALGVTFSIFIVSLLIFIPIFISITSASHNTKIELDAIKSKPASSDYRDLEKTIQETKRAADILRGDMMSRPHIASALIKALENKPKGVSIESLSWVNENPKIKLVVNGVADSRELLRQYVSLLQSNKSFSSVVIPVSAFAKAVDADFSITLEVVKEQ
ncbi:MAG TPA: hypothetical protein VJI33_02575 [Candidatus Paceibacterota bacterium]